jgi:peptide/nickel transport system permease protein
MGIKAAKAAVVAGIEVHSRPAPRRSRRGLRALGWGRKFSAAVIVVAVMVALLAPVLPIDAPNTGDVARRLLGIGSSGHLLGTDDLGRDMLSRLIWGSRTALLEGIAPVVVGGLIGAILGTIAGLGPQWARSLIMRALDVLFAFPALLLAIVIAATFPPGLITVILSITIIVIPPVARIVETDVVGLRHRDFLRIAKSSGAGWLSVTRRQVWPNVAPGLLVYCTSLVGLSIVYASGLSFLGLGVGAPTADWGSMVTELESAVFESPILSLLPAVPILVVSLAFNVLGDGLSRVLASDSSGG